VHSLMQNLQHSSSNVHLWQALHVVRNHFCSKEISRNFDFFGLIFHRVRAVKNLSSSTIKNQKKSNK